jgi:hypothetical protein
VEEQIMKKLFGVLSTGLLVAGLGMAGQTSAKTEAKQAGHDAKQAAKSTGKAAKHTGKAAAKGTKKGVNKAAGATAKGADKVKEKTQ